MAIKFLHDLDVAGNIDLNDNQSLNMVIQHLANNPTAVEGKIYYNTGSDKLMVCLGTQASDWTELSSATGDITSVAGGTNINVSGGDTGDATVNLDSSVTDAIALNTSKDGITSGQASAITANTSKNGISAAQANAISANTSKTGITSSQATAISTNSGKTGITSGQASAITANTAKNTDVNHNVTTDLSASANGTSLVIESSDGDNASLPAATTSAWGAMTDEQASAVIANTSKTGISSGQASAITANTSKTGITSGQASAITANTSKTGITSGQASAITANTNKTGISSAQASAITANSAKATDVNHNVTTDISITGSDGALTVVSSDGDDGEIPVATASVSGVMTPTQVTALGNRAPLASPTFTGTPTVPTPATSDNGRSIATTAFVKSNISDLVGGAPGALDTLNELAAAIGDDASYASGITTALGLKAPLASPAFSGTPTGITKAHVGLNNVANIVVSGTNTGDEPDASTTVKGIAERATTTEAKTGVDDTRFVTPAGLANRSYTTAIGGAASIAVTHNLGTKAVIVQMFDTSSFETVYAQVVRNTVNQVTVDFRTAPSAGDVTIMVIKVQ